MTTLAAWLEAEGAHHDVCEWAVPYADDWARAWAECPRGDWLLGIAARLDVDRRALVRAACACARLAFDQVPDDEARVLTAIEVAERWADGVVDDAARARAKADVEAAADRAPDPAVAAAATAALAAIGCVDAPDEAASAAAFAVQAAALDAGDCAVSSAVGYAQSSCADRVRSHIPFTAVEDARTRSSI